MSDRNRSEEWLMSRSDQRAVVTGFRLVALGVVIMIFAMLFGGHG
jgi:hypothetical protein